jgi:hypothetical protein
MPRSGRVRLIVQLVWPTLAVVASGGWGRATAANAGPAGPRPDSRLIIAATPIRPPDGDKYWAFHVVNDSRERIESIVLESVSTEWGDDGTSTEVGAHFGPLAAGSSVEIWRETDTEVRTSVELVVRGPKGERRVQAEFPSLYREVRGMVDLPILERKGLIATEISSSSSSSSDTGASPPPGRRDVAGFDRRARKIKVGASKEEVRGQLGAPRKGSAQTWTYHNPPDRPDGPYHWYTFTFSGDRVSKIEDGGVACVMRKRRLE